jgi:hypothetical protein
MGKFSGQVKRLLNVNRLLFWLRLGSSRFVRFSSPCGFALIALRCRVLCLMEGVWQGFIPFESQPN